MQRRKKKVALFFPSLGKIGGAERRLVRIISGINSNEIDVILAIHIINDANIKALKKEYQLFCNSKVEIQFFQKSTQVLKFFVDHRFDWVCYTDCYWRAFPAILGGIISNSNRLMLNVTTFSSSYGETNILKKIAYTVNVLLSTQLDCLYPTSLNVLRSKFKRKKITLTPGSFTDLRLFAPSAKKNIIAFVGRLIDIKQPELLAHAIVGSQETMRIKDYKCIICGEGVLKSRLQKILNDGNSADLCIFKDHCKAEDLLPNVKIFCSLQKFNNYPSQSLLEALASGCYCIATDEGDTNLIIKEDFGKLIKNSEKELTIALIEAMNLSDSELKVCEENARKFAVENFQIKKSVVHYERIFKG